MLFVPRGEILELLKSAFDEGWNGYQDLRDATADKLLDEYLAERKEKSDKGRSVPVEVHLEPLPESAFRSDEHPTPPVFAEPTSGQSTFEFSDGVGVDIVTPSSDAMEINWITAEPQAGVEAPAYSSGRTDRR